MQPTQKTARLISGVRRLIQYLQELKMNNPLNSMLQITIICLSLISCTLHAGEFPIPWQQDLGYSTNDIYPISIGKYGVPYVTVSVNGQKLNLVWDTGNMAGLTLNSDIAERMKLPIIGESKSFDSSGEVIGTFNVFNVSELIAFGEVWTEVPTQEFRTSDFVGLIGPRFVLNKRFTLDYRNKVIAISKTPLLRGSKADGVLPLIQSPQLQGYILVRGSVNGRKVLMEIDTGKSRTCVDPSLVVFDKLPEAENGYRLNEVKIGPYSFSVPSAKQVDFKGVSEGLPEPILLGIGSDILSQVILTVDYSRQVMIVSKYVE